jgi:stress response protein YsnF
MTLQEPEYSNHKNGNESIDIDVPLLAERLVIDRYKKKVGEVVVRKEIVTNVVEVLVRRERLIVEQVMPEYRQLAIVDLGDANSGAENAEVHRKFSSIKDAHEFLGLIASQPTLDVRTINISIELRPDF